MIRTLTGRTFRAAALLVVLSKLVACSGAGEKEAEPECAGSECDGGAGGGGGAADSLLDCPGLCREVAACSGEVDSACGTQCENTLAMASSLGCGRDYAGYVNCVLEAGDACARERPPECAGAYADLDTCLCAAVPEDCP